MQSVMWPGRAMSSHVNLDRESGDVSGRYVIMLDEKGHFLVVDVPFTGADPKSRERTKSNGLY